MSLNKNFCSSPWFHMRIGNNGSFGYCRWADPSDYQNDRNKTVTLANESPIQWFQKSEYQKFIRRSMLEGEEIPDCHTCTTMETYGKISGRQKQLLKIGVLADKFEKSLLSSPWLDAFTETLSGSTSQVPVDWQIDLGNYCNSACVFCGPTSSSRLAQELKTIGIIPELPPPNWSQDSAQLNKLLKELADTEELNPIHYIHFIGGEPMIIPAFKEILKRMVKPKAIGFTTNMTVWDDEIIELLAPHEVNLGLSIECFSELNDYVRYGSNITDIKTNLQKWVTVAKKYNWPVSLRITPTALTIGQIDTVYEYAWKNRIAVESCNYISEPAFFRISVLPKQMRAVAEAKLSAWVQSKRRLINNYRNENVVNVRDGNRVYEALIQDAESYITYLKKAPDESGLIKDLVQYLSALEKNRKNRILDYLPEYEQTLRIAGYRG